MLSMSINHPDIEDFITSKDDLSKLTGANISVRITDDFMKAVEDDIEYELEFIQDLSKDSSANIQKVFKKTVKAKKLWDKLIHQAWKSAEPKLWDLM